MKTKIALFVLFGSLWAQAASTFNVGNGETREISADTYDTFNCAGGSTIKFTSAFPETKGRYVFNGHFYLTDGSGPVTFDFSELPNRANGFHLCGSIVGSTQGGEAVGTLQVKGLRNLSVGSSGGVTSFAVWDVVTVAFLDDKSADVTDSLGSGEGILFAAQSTVWQNPSCRHEVLPGSEVALGNVTAEDFGCFTPDGNNEIVLDDKDFYIINTNLISGTATIRVKPGRRFSFKSAVRAYPVSWSGDTAVDLKNPVVLESEGSSRARLFHRSSKSCYILGPVTGDGDIEFTTDNYGTPCGGLLGGVSFTGTVFVHGNTGSNASNPSDFYIDAASPGDANNTLRIGGSTKTLFTTPNVARIPKHANPNVTIKKLEGVAENGYVGMLEAVAGQTITVHRVSGPVRLAGSGAFVLEQLDADADITVPPSVQLSYSSATVAPGARLVLTRDNDQQVLPVTIDGHACIIEPFAGVRAVTNVLFGGKLSSAETQTYRIRSGTDLSYRIDRADESWRNILTFWLDPTNLSRQVILDYTSTNATNPRIELIHDAREGQTYLLQNNYQRTSTGGQGGNWHKSDSPFMYRASKTVNGEDRPYLATGNYNSGSARRFYFGQEGVKPYASASISSKFVVMAVSVTGGGGKALVKDNRASDSCIFARCDKATTPTIDMPIFTNAAFTTWLDGVQVDPTTSKLKTGWQIVAFRTGGEKLAGIGYPHSNYQEGGGFDYGDVMVFSEELTDAQRRDVERRLSEKWGIPLATDDAPSSVAVGGTSALTIGAKTAVAPVGVFSGSIALEPGASLSVGVHTAVPTAADIAEIAGRVNWFDPDAEGALLFAETKHEHPEISALLDRADGDVEGHWLMYGSGSRYPWLNESSRHFEAPVRKWVDFSYANADDGMGNTLRYRPTPHDKDGNNDTTVNYSNNVQTVCTVYDSCRFGTPFSDKLDGTGLVKRRSAISDPIWPSGTSTILTGGKQYLNGAEVDGTKTAFGGKAEVFSFTTSGDFPLLCMGHYSTSQKTTNGGEILGESIFFSRVLEDAERQKVEAYLMAKWLGTSTGDWTDLTHATVTGSGAVVSPSLSILPKFGDGFTGTLNLVNEAPSLKFTVADGTVVDALDLKGGSLVLTAGSADVRVTFSGVDPNRARSFKLISWASGTAPDVTFNLTVDEQAGGKRPSGECTLSVEADGLYLKIAKPGLLLLLH